MFEGRQALNRSSGSSTAQASKDPKTLKRKQDELPTDPTGMKKSKNDPISYFLSEMTASEILQLSQSDLASRLYTAMSFMESQRSDVSDLEAEISRLQVLVD